MFFPYSSIFFNALWYQMIRIIAEIAKKLELDDDLLYYSNLSAKIKNSINDTFVDANKIYSIVYENDKSDLIFADSFE